MIDWFCLKTTKSKQQQQKKVWMVGPVVLWRIDHIHMAAILLLHHECLSPASTDSEAAMLALEMLALANIS